MGASCRRPGCHREAAASIGYDPVARQVWLDPLPQAPQGQHLCEEHAARLHAPRGWVVLDRRGEQGRIGASPTPSPSPSPRGATTSGTAAAGTGARRRPRRGGPAPSLDLDLVPAPDGAVDPPTAAAPPSVDPAAPEAGTTEDDEPATAGTSPSAAAAGADGAPGELGELLQPTSPLLRRAFDGGGPRRSVLLPDADADPDAGG